jgi:hypothetical protein
LEVVAALLKIQVALEEWARLGVAMERLGPTAGEGRWSGLVEAMDRWCGLVEARDHWWGLVEAMER